MTADDLTGTDRARWLHPSNTQRDEARRLIDTVFPPAECDDAHADAFFAATFERVRRQNGDPT